MERQDWVVEISQKESENPSPHYPGTTIKDTWMKPRGRVEAREGGGFGWGGEKMKTSVIEQQ